MDNYFCFYKQMQLFISPSTLQKKTIVNTTAQEYYGIDFHINTKFCFFFLNHN